MNGSVPIVLHYRYCGIGPLRVFFAQLTYTKIAIGNSRICPHIVFMRTLMRLPAQPHGAAPLRMTRAADTERSTAAHHIFCLPRAGFVTPGLAPRRAATFTLTLPVCAQLQQPPARAPSRQAGNLPVFTLNRSPSWQKKN